VSSLIERYVRVATDSVPEGQRAEVRTEIRAAVDEMVEQRLENGEPELVATRSALEELGDPRRLADQYRDTPQYLIGPGWFPLYIDVLKRVLPIGVAVVAVIAMVAKIATDDANLADVVGAGVGSAIDIGLQVLLWITVGFFIAERTVGPHPGADRGRAWSVDDLPEGADPRQIGLGETVGTVLTLVILGALVIFQHYRGVGFFIFADDSGDWENIPLINPDLGMGWVVGFVVVIAASVIVAIAGYLGRSYTRRLVMLTVIENVLWVGYILAVAASEVIVNPVFARRVSDGDGDWWLAGNEANWIVAIVFVAYSVWDVWEAWNRHRGTRTISEISARVA
jgi:hypothetical protein